MSRGVETEIPLRLPWDLEFPRSVAEDKSQSLYNNLGDKAINTGDKPWDTSKVYIRLSSPSLSSSFLLFILSPT